MKTTKKLRRSVGTSSASSWIRTPLARPRRSSALPKLLAQIGAAADRRGTAEKHRSWRGVARTSRCSLDIFSPVFQPPEGRRENSPGLQAWEGLRKQNRPERAADFRALFPKGNFVKRDSIAFRELTNLFWYKNLRARFGAKQTEPSNVITTYLCVGSQSPVRTPFQGDFVVRVVPRPERFRAWAILCSPFGRWRNVQTPVPGLKPWAVLFSPFGLCQMSKLHGASFAMPSARGSKQFPSRNRGVIEEVSTQMRPAAGRRGTAR